VHIILWFRQDLRLHDNLALCEAMNQANYSCQSIIPLYIHDVRCRIGSASDLWLYESLCALNASMMQYNLTQTHLDQCLMQFTGTAEEILLALCTEYNIQHVFCNSCHNPKQNQIDTNVRNILSGHNITLHTHHSYLLWDPADARILTKENTPYKVYTPFYKKAITIPVKQPQEIPNDLRFVALPKENAALKLHNHVFTHEKWHQKIKNIWNIGEVAAQKRLHEFCINGLPGYKIGRNYPSQDNVSRLSPHIHFGEISLNYIWHYVSNINTFAEDIDHYLSELGWREFSYYLLHHFPNIEDSNFQKKFDAMEWEKDENYIVKMMNAWKKGLTGIPIIDAGMVELWNTGYMNNRVRMIVGSFLTKNLGIDWRYGKAWFDDCLVDADQANNAVSWQWVAGSGADAAPYFRIFNPLLQSIKFDEDAVYIKKHLPVLQHVDPKYIHDPILNRNMLPCEYPMPIVDLNATRDSAIARYNKLS
jgi:deoxyribodipyrimidine photo-lyase